MYDNAPVGNTCPMIDDVKCHIDAVLIIDNLEDMDTDGLNQAFSTMEDIRSANMKLREFGNEQYYQCQKWEEEAENLNETVAARDEEIEQLQRRIEELEEQLEEAQQEIICQEKY